MTGFDKNNPHDRDGDALTNATDAEKRDNQADAIRKGVDADHGLDHRGHMTADPKQGSDHQPLREGSDANSPASAGSAGVAGNSPPDDDVRGMPGDTAARRD